MSGKIFVNYRRGDDAGFTQALYQRLELEFTAANIFMDVEGNIKPGDDFVQVLSTQIAASDVVLAIIGPRWEDLLAARGSDPDDFVTIEIKAALAQGKRVIPVLVGGSGMPRPELLPESIRMLARRNAVGLRPERFKSDCQGLIGALKEQLADAEKERSAQTEGERKSAEASRLQAEAKSASRVEAAEEQGRAQAAAGFSAEEVRKAEELAVWQFVKDRNDIRDLRDHLARFPGGTTERHARAKLDALVWTALGPAPDIDDLQAYLDEFPKGPNAGTAQTRMVKLENEAAEASAAEQRRVQETDEWAAIVDRSDIRKLETFLKTWPQGQHATAAEARIAELIRKEKSMQRFLVDGAIVGAGAIAGGYYVVTSREISAWTILLAGVMFLVGGVIAASHILLALVAPSLHVSHLKEGLSLRWEDLRELLRVRLGLTLVVCVALILGVLAYVLSK